MPYEQACPRCGREFVGEHKHAVADAVVEHARRDHHHALRPRHDRRQAEAAKRPAGTPAIVIE